MNSHIITGRGTSIKTIGSLGATLLDNCSLSSKKLEPAQQSLARIRHCLKSDSTLKHTRLKLLMWRQDSPSKSKMRRMYRMMIFISVCVEVFGLLGSSKTLQAVETYATSIPRVGSGDNMTCKGFCWQGAKMHLSLQCSFVSCMRRI